MTPFGDSVDSYSPASYWPAPATWATRDPEDAGAGKAAIHCWLDETRGRLWVQTFPGRYDNSELNRAFDHLEGRVHSVAQTGEQVVLVVDARFSKAGTPVQRRRIGQALARCRQADCIAAQAFVIETPRQRAALTAMLWLANPGWPVEVFTDRLRAVAWVSQRLHEASARREGGSPSPP